MGARGSKTPRSSVDDNEQQQELLEKSDLTHLTHWVDPAGGGGTRRQKSPKALQ